MLTACPACGSALGPPLITRLAVPVHQNLLCRTEAEALAVRRGDLNLSECPACGLVCNASFDPALLSYEGSYDSDQSFSRAFEQHVDGLVERLVASGVAGRRVVEVGCGSGYFLRHLCAAGRCQGEGYDPGYRGPELDVASGARFVRGTYEPTSAATPPDVLVCRHVIEHVPQPARFVAGLTPGLPPAARVYFETPALEWIIEQCATWDLFYEHCNYFTEAALANAFRCAGLAAHSISRLFGGQYYWIEARATAGDRTPSAPTGPALSRLAETCARAEGALRRQLEDLAGRGRVAVWGAAAKGATFANLLDPDRQRIECLVDISPARQGRYVAGSGHAILSPAELRDRGVTDVIVMNPNYEAEIGSIVEAASLRVMLHMVGRA